MLALDCPVLNVRRHSASVLTSLVSIKSVWVVHVILPSNVKRGVVQRVYNGNVPDRLGVRWDSSGTAPRER
jgi:hypothetical protein